MDRIVRIDSFTTRDGRAFVRVTMEGRGAGVGAVLRPIMPTSPATVLAPAGRAMGFWAAIATDLDDLMDWVTEREHKFPRLPTCGGRWGAWIPRSGTCAGVARACPWPLADRRLHPAPCAPTRSSMAARHHARGRGRAADTGLRARRLYRLQGPRGIRGGARPRRMAGPDRGGDPRHARRALPEGRPADRRQFLLTPSPARSRWGGCWRITASAITRNLPLLGPRRDQGRDRGAGHRRDGRRAGLPALDVEAHDRHARRRCRCSPTSCISAASRAPCAWRAWPRRRACP